MESYIAPPQAAPQPPLRFSQETSSRWKCEAKLLPPPLELSASLTTTDSWLQQLCGALGIKLSSDGHPQYPNGFYQAMAKEWLMSIVDEDMKSRLNGVSGDLVLQDLSVMDTVKRARAIVEAETPLYSRCHTYFALWQDKEESSSSFMF